MLLGTTITPDMVDKNLRIQLNYFVLCKKDTNNLHYKIFDMQSQTYKLLSLKRDPNLFDYVKYDTEEIPKIFRFNIEEYIKLNENKKYFS